MLIIKFILFSYYIRKKRILKNNCPNLHWGISHSGTCLDIAPRLRYNGVDI